MTREQDDNQPGAPERAVRTVFDTLNVTGSAWIVLLMLAVCADVICRTAFARPIDGVAEFSALSVVCIVFFQLPAAIAGRRLTVADALLSWLTGRYPAAGRALGSLWSMAGLCVYAAIAYAVWNPGLRAFQRGDFIGVQGIFTFPAWVVWGVIEAGALLACVAYALRVCLPAPTGTPELSHV